MSKGTTAIAKRSINTKEARTIATRTLSYHEGTKRGAEMTLVNALACGIQLQRAKELLPHGQFMAWRKSLGSSVSPRTLDNYLALVNRLAGQLGSKFATVANLLDIAPENFTPKYAVKIMPTVKKLVEGRTVRELYEGLGIIKPKQTKARAFQDKVGPSTGDPKADSEARAKVWADELLHKLGTADTFASHLTDDDLSAIIQSMVSAAGSLGVSLTVSRKRKSA